MPPKSSIAAVWSVEGFGQGKGLGGGNAPIHFGDTPAESPAGENKSVSRALPKAATKKLAKAAAAGKPAVSRKAQR
jgi:hypothetical protein